MPKALGPINCELRLPNPWATPAFPCLTDSLGYLQSQHESWPSLADTTSSKLYGMMKWELTSPYVGCLVKWPRSPPGNSVMGTSLSFYQGEKQEWKAVSNSCSCTRLGCESTLHSVCFWLFHIVSFCILLFCVQSHHQLGGLLGSLPKAHSHFSLSLPLSPSQQVPFLLLYKHTFLSFVMENVNDSEKLNCTVDILLSPTIMSCVCLISSSHLC